MINVQFYMPLINVPGLPIKEFLEQFGPNSDGSSYMDEYELIELTKRVTFLKEKFQSQFEDEVEVLFSVQWSRIDKGGPYPYNYFWIYHWGESAAGITDRDPHLLFLREIPNTEGKLFVADGNPRQWDLHSTNTPN